VPADAGEALERPPTRAPTVHQEAFRFVGSRRKPLEAGIPFGCCFLTERLRGSEVIGYQMTCTRPAHNETKRCTKELSIQVAGGRDLLMRRLKAWIVFGASSDNQQQHFESWKLIMALTPDAGLPSEEALDASAPLDWTAPGQLEAIARASPSPASRRAAADLGAAAAGCPADVHQRMQDLYARGALPLTSPEQRSRQRLSAGTDYGVPRMYREALHHGYLNPNLPPPDHYLWRCRGAVWTLAPRGG